MTAQDLKNAIFQLAVQGKLVPQDPNDEPASELLKRIKVEKERLIKEGLVSIEKKHTPSPIAEDDIPYDIPDTWCWVKFADIVTFYSGKTPERHTAEYWNNGECTWVSIADMVADGITVETKEKITKTALSDCFLEKMSPAGTIIMSFKLTIGKISVLGVDAVHNEAIISIFPFLDDATLKDYLFKVLPLVANGGDSKNAIKGKTLNSTSLSNLMIPLPPLAEQRRIVAKIEELMPLVEEYGKAEERLTVLNAEFPDKLRKSILQQAIQGKLTERNPADEPASELLTRIRAEKERLVKEGKIKKEKTLPPITEEEMPFELPDNWAWVRLGEIINTSSGTNITASEMAKTDSLYPVYGGNGINGYYDKFNVPKDTLVIGRVGYYCGSVHLTKKDAWVTDNALIVRFDNNNILTSFLQLMLTYADLGKKSESTAQPLVTGKIIKPHIIALPPLAEQQRIVDRVNELLALCDELK